MYTSPRCKMIHATYPIYLLMPATLLCAMPIFLYNTMKYSLSRYSVDFSLHSFHLKVHHFIYMYIYIYEMGQLKRDSITRLKCSRASSVQFKGMLLLLHIIFLGVVLVILRKNLILILSSFLYLLLYALLNVILRCIDYVIYKASSMHTMIQPTMIYKHEILFLWRFRFVTQQKLFHFRSHDSGVYFIQKTRLVLNSSDIIGVQIHG